MARTRWRSRKLLEAALADLKPLIAREGITMYDRAAPAGLVHRASLRTSVIRSCSARRWWRSSFSFFLGHVRTALISLARFVVAADRGDRDDHSACRSTRSRSAGSRSPRRGRDDAIIDVENIVRRLRENQNAGAAAAAMAVVLSASIEVRNAVVYATLIVICVFLPVLTLTDCRAVFLPPLAGRIFYAIRVACNCADGHAGADTGVFATT